MLRAIYAGSFDCYTNGHHDIVKRASNMFDELHILIAVNSDKYRTFPAEDMYCLIRSALEQDEIENCIVKLYDGLVAEYAEQNRICYLIRGLRNTMDYQYEENIASINRLICPKLETIYFRTNNAAISSSMVRDMIKYGKDTSEFVPGVVHEYLKAIPQSRRIAIWPSEREKLFSAQSV